MRFKHLITTGLIISVAAVSACSQNGGRDGGIKKSDIGTLLGGAGGAALGSQFGKGNGRVAMIAAGTLLGAFAGNQFGQSLDNADMAYHNQASHSALEGNKSGIASNWSNPDTGHSGTITPTRTYQTAQGTYCREFNQSIMVGGKREEAFGTACRQPDGSWKLVN